MTRCVVDAVVASGCYAILSKGWSDRGSKKEDKDGEKDKEAKDEKDEKDGADGVKYPPEI
jgi:sterol 3beta-glucosyltransferase